MVGFLAGYGQRFLILLLPDSHLPEICGFVIHSYESIIQLLLDPEKFNFRRDRAAGDNHITTEYFQTGKNSADVVNVAVGFWF